MTNKVPTSQIEWDWVWAYREQLRLLDGFDSQGLYCARHGWTDASWGGFLREYAVGRGYQAGLRKKLSFVLQELEELFREDLPNMRETEALKERWFEGVGRIGKLADKKRKDNSDPHLWSITAKLLWFYQPEHMTMVDGFAKYGISNELKQQGIKIKGGVTEHNFLELFEKLYKEKIPAIEAASRLSDRKYPYPKRVVDKWLWLNGSKKKEVLLERFEWSRDRAPIAITPITRHPTDMRL